MSRVRVSTTVDSQRLQQCRLLLREPDSALIDRALALLLEELRAQKEIQALKAMPYEQDADLSWDVPYGPDLPYDGDIPAEVVALAERRRRAS